MTYCTNLASTVCPLMTRIRPIAVSASVTSDQSRSAGTLTAGSCSLEYRRYHSSTLVQHQVVEGRREFGVVGGFQSDP